MNVIEGSFGKPQGDLEDRVVQEMIVSLEETIQEVVAKGVDYLVITTVSGPEVTGVRIVGLGCADLFKALGVLEAAKNGIQHPAEIEATVG